MGGGTREAAKDLAPSVVVWGLRPRPTPIPPPSHPHPTPHTASLSPLPIIPPHGPTARSPRTRLPAPPCESPEVLAPHRDQDLRRLGPEHVPALSPGQPPRAARRRRRRRRRGAAQEGNRAAWACGGGRGAGAVAGVRSVRARFRARGGRWGAPFASAAPPHAHFLGVSGTECAAGAARLTRPLNLERRKGRTAASASRAPAAPVTRERVGRGHTRPPMLCALRGHIRAAPGQSRAGLKGKRGRAVRGRSALP